MKYFTMDEMTRSDTARVRHIDNTPTAEHRAHLTELVDRLLDPLREGWEEHCSRAGRDTAAIRVSSGYRGFRLNEVVRGAKSSAHCLGYAADLMPLNGRMREFKDFCRGFLTQGTSARPFDQMISEDENAAGIPVWIHVGLKDGRGAQRGQLLTMRGGKYVPMTR